MLDLNKALSYWECINNSQNKELINNFKISALRYTRYRVKDLILINKGEEINKNDVEITFNNFLDVVDSLSKEMNKNNEDTQWRLELGDDKKMIADFACYISLILSFNTR